ncbi:MAG: Uma2 family endonuclease [Bacteroidia bacterium]
MNSFTLDIPQSRSWTEDELFLFCAANKNLRIERDANGFITIISPSGGLSSYYISTLNADLVIWNRKQKPGYIFESSAGFLLPDGSMRAPDIAFVSKENWNKLTLKEKQQFPPLCPEFVIEVRSPSDRLPTLKEKMKTLLVVGCWLLVVVASMTVPQILFKRRVFARRSGFNGFTHGYFSS